MMAVKKMVSSEHVCRKVCLGLTLTDEEDEDDRADMVEDEYLYDQDYPRKFVLDYFLNQVADHPPV